MTIFEVLGILKPFFKEGFKPPEARTFFNVFIKDSYYLATARGGFYYYTAFFEICKEQT